VEVARTTCTPLRHDSSPGRDTSEHPRTGRQAIGQAGGAGRSSERTTVGEIVDYQGMFLLCYVRGPEGLIIELAERLRPGST
jgi:hypothetical protein